MVSHVDTDAGGREGGLVSGEERIDKLRVVEDPRRGVPSVPPEVVPKRRPVDFIGDLVRVLGQIERSRQGMKSEIEGVPNPPGEKMARRLFEGGGIQGIEEVDSSTPVLVRLRGVIDPFLPRMWNAAVSKRNVQDLLRCGFT